MELERKKELKFGNILTISNLVDSASLVWRLGNRGLPSYYDLHLVLIYLHLDRCCLIPFRNDKTNLQE